MAQSIPGKKPPMGRWLALSCLAATMMGVTGAGFLEQAWHNPAPTPHMDLRRAVTSFDTGHLTAATAAFRTLADAGNPQAAYWYGHALELGLGTSINVKAAITQYERAWNGGVTQAGTRLGELYLDGNAIPPEFAKGRQYLTEAARRGSARAAFDLGHMLQQGVGGPADPVAAYAWLEVATLRGDAQARPERDRLLPTLSPAQQAQASEMAARDLPVVAANKPASPAKPSSQPEARHPRPSVG